MQNVDAVDVSGHEMQLVDLDDGSLLAMARSGHREAYATLFSRYSYAAHRLARHLGQKEDSDDVVSEAFAQVLDLIGRGKGPDTAFRAYLFTTVRHECARRAKARKRVTPTDDLRQIDSPVEFGNGDLDGFERSAIRAAYESLPPRWRTVLWHLDVEGRKPHELGPLLDMSANSVSALVYRARAGLREAYLQQHVKDEQPDGSRACRELRAKLSAFVRRTASTRDQERIHAHLESCQECMSIYLDLQEVNREVGVVSTAVASAGAIGLTAASVGAHVTVLLKGLIAVLLPPAAAAAIASAALISVPADVPKEPSRQSLAVAGPQAGEVQASGRSDLVAAAPAEARPVAGTRTTRSSGEVAPPRTVVSSAPDAAPARARAVDRPTAASPAVPASPVASAATPPRVALDLAASADGTSAPRLTASLGPVDVSVGGTDGVLSLVVDP